MSQDFICDKSILNQMTSLIGQLLRPIDDLVQLSTAAKMMKVRRQTIEKMIQQGRFKTIKVDKTIFLLKSEVIAFKPGWSRPDLRTRKANYE
jgi:hypothetical protein